jgi:DNA (cytosine-5)-methyltransferase 1
MQVAANPSSPIPNPFPCPVTHLVPNVTPQRRVTRRWVTTPNIHSGPVTPQFVLSLFPGVGLLDRAFAAEGICIVTGPEWMFGRLIEDFDATAARGRVTGVMGGVPCQDFSSLRRCAPSGHGVEMIRQFLRVVWECEPDWFLMECVPHVPDVRLAGYAVQRLDLSDRECGGRQLRNRHWQYGDRRGWILRPERIPVTARGAFRVVTRRPVTAAALASHARENGKSYRQHCIDQGLPGALRLPGLSPAMAWRAVGNGVPLGMGRVMARAVLAAGPRDASRDCRCGCGRPVTPQRRDATAACRKRLERARRGTRSVVTWP